MSKHDDRGFTLLETVVALGVLSTAAISFGVFSQNSLSGTVQLENHYLARTVADAQLVDVFAQAGAIEVGSTAGVHVQMGREFEWVRTISPSTQDGLFLVNVQVTQSGEDTIIVDISTLRNSGL